MDGAARRASEPRRSHRQDRVSSVQKGRIGERQAAAYLRERGYRIVERNVRVRMGRRQVGEIDLVACRGDSVVFVEVKAWSSFGAADLAAVVNDRKRLRIVRTAAAFLARTPSLQRFRPRFDVLLLRSGQPPLHIESAFGADGDPL